jgi:hypothetical protein
MHLYTIRDDQIILLVALVSHLPESQMAVGTGFAQLLRGLGSSILQIHAKGCVIC